MKNYFLLLLASFIFFACGLSPEEELNLSRDITSFIEARNSGDAVEVIGFTHPKVVKEYLQKEEDSIITRFKELPLNISFYELEDSVFYWEKYYVKSVSRNDFYLEIDIDISAINNLGEKKYIPYKGVSLNEGDNWLFFKKHETDLVY